MTTDIDHSSLHDQPDLPVNVALLGGQVELGGSVDALFMGAGFASEVNSFLVRHLFWAPIIVTAGEPSEWIFLTQPRTPMRTAVWEDLVRLQIGWKRHGETITLPAPGATTQGVRWLQQPGRHTTLPPWTAVVAAARSVSSPSRTS
ncbi:hypothetical protein [Amycolatopsis pigmentata]|uniref:Uncharacterized protein n=1 Tax=Amycolatopsis pigmentata TaxID=450801 RepID=A0ABW5FIT9_9PSEU